MYIEPNSNIKIYHNVPLDNTYNHTIYFSSLSAQNNYFHGNQNILKYNLSSQSYQRVVKGNMRVGVKADNLYDCNYLAFQNASFGTKWFYAFIISVEYVNNETSEITFEIDVMQTYFFDVELKKCFVEREHSKTDGIGDNIKAENVKVSDYVQNGEAKRCLGASYSPSIIIACSVEYESGDWQPVDGELYDRCYQGVKFHKFTPTITDPSGGANKFLKRITNDAREDSIVSVFMCDSHFLDERDSQVSVHLGDVVGNTLDGYAPRNNKMFTAPYNLLYATTGDGCSSYYKFEYFSNPRNIDFSLLYALSCNPQVTLVPNGYKKNYTNGLTTNLDLDNTLTLNNYPLCSYTIDSFRAWLAQNRYNIISSTINSYGETISGALNGEVRVGGLLNLTSSILTASLLPPSTRGNASSSNTFFSNDVYDFWISRKSVNYQTAKMIDDYFSYYGYTCGELKIPNRNSRPHWNYVKTKGCIVKGNAPADDVRKICGIYDNGITFWKNASEVGEYGLDNSPS